MKIDAVCPENAPGNDKYKYQPSKRRTSSTGRNRSLVNHKKTQSHNITNHTPSRARLPVFADSRIPRCSTPIASVYLSEQFKSLLECECYIGRDRADGLNEFVPGDRVCSWLVFGHRVWRLRVMELVHHVQHSREVPIYATAASERIATARVPVP